MKNITQAVREEKGPGDLSLQPRKVWIERSWDGELAGRLAAELGVPAAIGALLLQRGLAGAEEAEAFLSPGFEQLPSPFLMQGMREAVGLLAAALVQKRPVLIYGDYDVDGATGTAVLALFLVALGLEVQTCQPHRLADGYGLHAHLVRDLQARAPGGVLVTVDCGISDEEAVAAARECGLSVIVTDHHEPPARLPAAHAILNPRQPGCAFPFKHLAGVGVAFYLAMGLRAHLHEQGAWLGREGAVPNLRDLLDLVAVGTISDMVPLLGPNRVFARAGLEVLQEAGRPGLRLLLETAGVQGRRLTAEDVGFRIGPRINAAGRTGDPGKALALLLTEDWQKGRQLAADLETENRKRQALEKELFGAAAEQAEAQLRQGRRALVLRGANWHPGVLGIVASRLLNRYYRTTILLAEKEGLLKGSGRSVPGVNLHHSLAACADLLAHFGGHANAAGLTLVPERLPAFQDRLDSLVAGQLGADDLHPKLILDHPVSTDLFDQDFLRHYLRLAPFGIGNPEPVFGMRGCRLLRPQIVGGSHLKFFWPHHGSRLEGIGFGLGHLQARLEQEAASLAFTLRRKEFRGRERWQLSVVDLAFP